ncbi:hypothetical protein [Sphingobacterium mizutaii]|uniref:hypothetical protein n=1 Tax=Sphingobacterium mizutaii TaxID=1010 RepID=UPI001628D092|nr:hypothetical protein [Sphingobacterium mizutaii]
MKLFKRIDRSVQNWWYYLDEETKEMFRFYFQVIAIAVMAFFFLYALYVGAS